MNNNKTGILCTIYALFERNGMERNVFSSIALKQVTAVALYGKRFFLN